MRLTAGGPEERRETIRKKKMFRHIFHLMAVCMAAVVLLLSTLTYSMVKKAVAGQNIETAMGDFREIREAVGEAGKLANSLATQLLLDDVCSGMLFAGGDGKMNAAETARVVNQVALYGNMNDSAESIYLYNREQDMFITSQTQAFCRGSSDFFDQGIVEIINDYDRYRDRDFIRRRILVPYSNGYEKEEEVYTYILDGMKGSRLQVAVIVNLSMDSLYNSILQTQGMQDSYMLVTDETGETVMELCSISNIGAEALEEPVRLMAESGKQYMDYTWQGEKYFVSCLFSEREGWNYVKATKWSTVFGILSEIRKAVAVLAGIILLAALSASLISSFSIYRVYTAAEREYRRLTGHKKKERDALRESFLYDFINRRKQFAWEELDGELTRYGLGTERRYTLAVLKIDRYQELTKRFGEDGIYDIKYGFRNVFEEVSRRWFEAEGIIFRDNTILFLIGTQKQDIHGELAYVFESFCEKVKIFLEWDFHMMGIGEYVSGKQLPRLKDKLWPEVHNLYFYPPNILTDYEVVKGKYTKPLDYARLDQKQLLEALHGGNREEIREAYHKFLRVLSGCDAIDYKNALTWLGFSVARIRGSGGAYLLRLADCDTAEGADRILEEMFGEILRRKAAAMEQGGIRGRMEEVKSYIKEEFRDPNLSLALLGSEFGVSPAYLGKHFKQNFGKSVAEYINEVRLEAVTEQLLKTQRPARDIAVECGFGGANYFYTSFKKKMGMTPQAYRDKNMK